MKKWIEKFTDSTIETKGFIFSVFILSLIVIAAVVFSYVRLF